MKLFGCLVLVTAHPAEFIYRIANLVECKLQVWTDGEFRRFGPWFMGIDEMIFQSRGWCECEKQFAAIV